MFENAENTISLEEEVFDEWLEKGKESRIGYHYMLVVWNEFDSKYQPIYSESRDQMVTQVRVVNDSSTEALLAVYDLYSETKLSVIS